MLFLSRTPSPMDSSRSFDADAFFKEGYHALQHIEEGITFPKILLPHSAQQNGVAALVQGIASKSVWLEEELHRHSAILFRGFSVQTAEEFAAVARAFGWEPMKYLGMARRCEVLSGIYTANEGPIEEEIWLHHEMAQAGSFPSKIMFFCEVEPRKGGETTIVLSHKAVEQTQTQFPALIKDLEKHGILLNSYLASQDAKASVVGKGWQTLLGTTDEADAEKRLASKYGGRIEWQPDKTAKVILGPLQATKSFRTDGRKVLFRNIAAIYKDINSSVTFGDGSELPAEAVKGCDRILKELVVEIPWQQGDVLVVDNLAVMHGRRAGAPPRRILVSLYNEVLEPV